MGAPNYADIIPSEDGPDFINDGHRLLQLQDEAARVSARPSKTVATVTTVEITIRITIVPRTALAFGESV